MKCDRSHVGIGVGDLVKPKVVGHVRHLPFAVKFHGRLFDFVGAREHIIARLFNTSGQTSNIATVTGVVVDFGAFPWPPTKNQKRIVFPVRCDEVSCVGLLEVEEGVLIRFILS